MTKHNSETPWNAALEAAAKVAEYHNENHFENQDDRYRNCGLAIASGIRDLKRPVDGNQLRLAIEQQAKYYFSEIRKFQPLDLDHYSLENWKDFIMWRERRRVD